MNALRTLAIIGGGSAGWMTAAALVRVLDATTRIILVESDAIGTIGVGEATIPPIQRFNALLGLDENTFVRRTQGSFKLGIEFVGWRQPGHRYFHPFGVYGADIGPASFDGLWQRLNGLGRAQPLEDFSLNAVAARADRFLRPAPASDAPLAQLGYAYHFDAALYAQLLGEYAQARGVTRREGEVVSVRRREHDDGIAAVTLASGEQIEADFFIDCSGFRALLIDRTLGSAFQDWSPWLFNDRAVAVPCARTDAFSPYTRSTARAAGWQWRIPLQHRVGNGYVYASASISDDEATAGLLSWIEGERLAEPRVLRFRPGRREACWVGNCLAIGLSAGFLEPLESTSLYLIQAGIGRFLEMLPGRDGNPADVRRYNRLMAQEFDAIRDFVILHFHGNARPEAYWKRAREMAIPESLAERLRTYAASGRVYREGDELFSRTSWMAIMEGQGPAARGFDPLAATVPADAASAYLERIAGGMRSTVARMPSHEDYVRAYCAA